MKIILKGNKEPPSLMFFTVFFIFLCLPSHALVGIGAHKGVDFSVEMKDATSDMTFENRRIVWGSAADSVIDNSITYTFERKKFRRTHMNFGGKFYVDIIPVIDAAELSFNFGVWEYECDLTYPYFSESGNGDIYDTSISITPQNYNIEPRWGAEYLPYTKLHLDFTIRKYIIRIPKKLKLMSLYAGGGFNIIMETPLITEKKLREEFESALEEKDYNARDINNNDKIAAEGAIKTLIYDVTEGLGNRSGGIHFTAGLSFGPPIVPLSIYADSKVIIPFTELGGDAELGGIGFVLNAGVALSIPETRGGHTEGFE